MARRYGIAARVLFRWKQELAPEGETETTFLPVVLTDETDPLFIAYLEDREIIGGDYFRAASSERSESFAALLQSGNVTALKKLFVSLREDFNGDLFVAPCSFEPNSSPPLSAKRI